ncbi:MAG TPA: site-specific integrase [Bacteroidia bacterium]|jgi:integrase|nr:site-specific integrase [Bacteroidia bacterium]
MVNFNFNLKKKSSSTETPVNLIIRFNKQKLTYSTHEKINPKFWQGDRNKRRFQRAIETKSFPEFPEFNLRLDKLESQAKTLFRQFLNDNDNKYPTVIELKELLDVKLRRTEINKPEIKENKKATFFEFFQKFIDESNNKVNEKTGKKFSRFTLGGYKNTLKILRDFSTKYDVLTDFDVIDMDWYHSFVSYLTKDLNLATNTIGNQIKIVKVILNDATERGLNNNQVFRSRKFRKVTEMRDEIYITEEELTAIENLDLSHCRRLDCVRDAFLISCYSGLRYSDLASLTKENLQDNYIKFRSVKTGQGVVVPIHKTVKAIIEKYKDTSSISLLPMYSNVKMNLYLKELAQMVPALNVNVTFGYTKGGNYVEHSISKHSLVKTHTGRRTFATLAYKKGIPTRIIMAATGHRTETSFMKYLKTTAVEDAALLEKYW